MRDCWYLVGFRHLHLSHTCYWKDSCICWLHFIWCNDQGSSCLCSSWYWVTSYCAIFLYFVLKYFQVFLYLVTIALNSKLLTSFFEIWNVFLFFFFPWCYHVLFLRMFSLSVIPFQLLHIKCDNDEHMFQRPSTFFWCNNEDSPPCLDISSIALTPRSSPDSRLPPGLLIPPPSKSGLPKPASEYSCPRPRVILLCKSFFSFGVFWFFFGFLLFSVVY